MPSNETPEQAARQLRRAALGAGVAAVIALILALGALLGLVSARAAAEGCIALAVLAGGFHALLRSGRRLPAADPGLATAQVVLLYVLLAYLTLRTAADPLLLVPYMVVTLYGLLRLDAQRLVVVAMIALVLHGVAIFMLADRGELADPAAAWARFGALVLGMLWSAWAAVPVTRLRASVADAHGRLHAAENRAQVMASRDAATGAYHRNVLQEALEREASRASRIGSLLCIARVELDRLRAVNERFGSDAGDAALKRFAAVAHRVARDVDTFGRWSGKGFLLIMPDTGFSRAIIGAERLRAAVEREAFAEVAGEWQVTCSAGLAQYRNGEDLSLVLARAEAALVYARAAGRNRVIAFDEEGKPVAA